MKTRNNRLRPERVAVGTVLVVVVLLTGVMPGGAQTSEGQPLDVSFEVINSTTGEGASVERMTIDYVTARRNNVADFEPAGPNFVARSVPIKEAGKYIVTVWHQGVPYWWSKRGRDFEAGPVVLHVFDTTDKLDGVTLSGLNLVLRRQESLLRIEYMLQVNNAASPQITVVGRPESFEIALPMGVSDISASYTRGPDPTPVEVETSGTQAGLVVPLTPGQNLIRLEAVVPWVDGMTLPLGANIAVTEWSVLASPEWLKIGSTDLEENDSEEVPGFRRFAGFPLEADETITLRLNSGEVAAGPQEDLFTKDAPAEQEAAQTDEEVVQSSSKSLPLIFLGVIIIVIIVATIRRRS